MPFVVTALDDDQLTWSWIARLGTIAVALHHDLSTAPRGTTASLVLEGPALVVARPSPADCTIQRQLGLSLPS